MDHDYEQNELRMLQKQLAGIEKESLANRKLSCAEWSEAMRKDPDVVAERVSWVLNGTMGYGAKVYAERIAKNTRMNRVAALAQLTAQLDWQCPARMAVAAWKKLPREAQVRLNKAINEAIEAHLRGE